MLVHLESFKIKLGSTDFYIITKETNYKKQTREKWYSFNKDIFESLCEQIDKIRETLKDGGIGICGCCGLPIHYMQYFYKISEEEMIHKDCIIEYLESNNVKITGKLEVEMVEKQKEAE